MKDNKKNFRCRIKNFRTGHQIVFFTMLITSIVGIGAIYLILFFPKIDNIVTKFVSFLCVLVIQAVIPVVVHQYLKK